MLAANDGKIFKHNDLAPDDYMPELYRVLRSPAHCYVMTNEFNRRLMEDAAIRAGFQVHALLVWIKQNVTPSRWYMKNIEFTLFLRKGPARAIYNPGSKLGHEFHNPVGSKLHPTEKPVDLMRLYIENSSLPGQIVLDPFAGAGSTIVAARDSGRYGVGIEMDTDYAFTACRRLRVVPG
jgi:DNA modification methylase